MASQSRFRNEVRSQASLSPSSRPSARQTSTDLATAPTTLRRRNSSTGLSPVADVNQDDIDGLAEDERSRTLGRMSSIESLSWIAVPSLRSVSSVSSLSVSEDVDSDLGSLGVRALRYRRRSRRASRRSGSEPADRARDGGSASQMFDGDDDDTTSQSDSPGLSAINIPLDDSPVQFAPSEVYLRDGQSETSLFQLPMPFLLPRLDSNSDDSGQPSAETSDGDSAGYFTVEITPHMVEHVTAVMSASENDTEQDTDADRDTEAETDVEPGGFNPRRLLFADLDPNTAAAAAAHLDGLPGETFFSSTAASHTGFVKRRGSNSLRPSSSTSDVAAGPSTRRPSSSNQPSSFSRYLADRRRPSQAQQTDEMLRTSLATLLSCAAATRGFTPTQASPGVETEPADVTTKVDKGKGRMLTQDPSLSGPTPANSRSVSSEPVSLRFVSEASVISDRSHRFDSCPTTLWSQSQHSDPTSTQAHQYRPQLAKRTGSSSSTASSSPSAPTLVLPFGIPRSALPYILSLSVLVAVGTISFSAGYFLGRVPGITGEAANAAAAVSNIPVGLSDDVDNLFFSGWPALPTELIEMMEELALGGVGRADSGVASTAASIGEATVESASNVGAGIAAVADGLTSMSAVEKMLMVGGVVGGVVAGKGLLADW